MDRIFHVRLNLDKVSADNDTFSTDQERGEWLRGFLSAARGGCCRFADGSPGSLGHVQGAESLRFAKGFSAAQAVKGQKSAEARKSNHGSTTVQPRLDQGSTVVEPNLNLSNNPIIQESNNPRNEQSNAHARDDGNPFPSSGNSNLPIPDSLRWNYEQAKPWAKALVKAGAKIGPQNWPAWKGLTERYPVEAVLGALAALSATDRWPDQTEDKLSSSRGQIDLTTATKRKTITLVQK
jgi:hypothetical protein